MSNINYQELYSYARNIACNASVETAPDRAVFFASGRKKREAIAFCKSNKEAGFQTILSTEAWKNLAKQNLINKGSPFTLDDKLNIRNIICERFSYYASGDVTLLFNPKRPYGTLFDIELPILINNLNVTSINGDDKSEFSKFLDYPSELSAEWNFD